MSETTHSLYKQVFIDLKQFFFHFHLFYIYICIPYMPLNEYNRQLYMISIHNIIRKNIVSTTSTKLQLDDTFITHTVFGSLDIKTNEIL